LASVTLFMRSFISPGRWRRGCRAPRRRRRNQRPSRAAGRGRPDRWPPP